MMDGSYITLKICQDDALNRRGKMIVCRDSDLLIGQTEGCGLRLSSDPVHEDAEIAVIRKGGSGASYVLVRLSQYAEHDVAVNGVVIDSFCSLSDGDTISFPGQRQEVRFAVRRDGKYDRPGVAVVESGMSPKLTAFLILFPLVLFAGLLWLVMANADRTRISSDSAASICESVYQIQVDSVSYVSISGKDTTLIARCATDVSGTAFFTEDSLLVTARHCLEPWLNIPDKILSELPSSGPVYVSWALLAETHNQFSDGRTLEQVVSHCSLYSHEGGKSKVMTFSSDDFRMDKSRDVIMEIGDIRNLYFWRSISSRPRRSDMMLGDVAFMKIPSGRIAGKKGTVRLAGKGQMHELWESDDRVLTCFGFPVSENIGEKMVEKMEFHLAGRFILGEDGMPSTPLYHDRRVSEGFSGGPVVCRLKGGCYAVGVVSVIDKNNSDRTYSVPVTEITKMQENGQE